MIYRLIIFFILIFLLSSCSWLNSLRIQNLSGFDIVIKHYYQTFEVDKIRNISLKATSTSRRLSFSKPSAYELSKKDEPECRYRYPTLEAFTIPDGRTLFDGKSPRTVTLIVIDKDFVARAYAYEKGKSWEQSTELRGGGFPAQPVRSCNDE